MFGIAADLLIDLVAMRAFVWADEGLGEDFEETQIPAELAEDAALFRDELVSQVADLDDEVAELFLAAEPVDAETLKAGIRRITLRTAVLHEGQWRLFAGAGIVEGSVPAAEWEETGMKFTPVLEALEASGIRVEPGASGASIAATTDADAANADAAIASKYAADAHVRRQRRHLGRGRRHSGRGGIAMIGRRRTPS